MAKSIAPIFLSMLMVFLISAMRGGGAATPGSALSATYYDDLCPGGTKKFQSIVLVIVTAKILTDPLLIPALMRLGFHDGFVEGADSSITLDPTPSDPNVEKIAIPNNPSVRGYELIDAIKTAVELWCPRVVSCADIIQESVRAAMKILPRGSLPYKIKYGRRDGNVSRELAALQNLPPPFFKYNQLIASFANKAFNATELMLLSGTHAFGVSHCSSFTSRLYNFFGNGSGTDPALDPAFAEKLKAKCPQNAAVDNTVPLNHAKRNPTFDNSHYKNILAGKALFTSDNELNVGDPAGVALYAGNNQLFRADIVPVLVKLTELQVKLYPDGEIRKNCRRRN